MTVIGLFNKKIKGVWIVYITVKRTKYFIGAYRTEEKAKDVAERYYGKYFYKYK